MSLGISSKGQMVQWIKEKGGDQTEALNAFILEYADYDALFGERLVVTPDGLEYIKHYMVDASRYACFSHVEKADYLYIDVEGVMIKVVEYIGKVVDREDARNVVEIDIANFDRAREESLHNA